MSKTSTNTAAVPEAKGALDRFKFEVANELGVPLSDGYNGNLTSKQNVANPLTIEPTADIVVFIIFPAPLPRILIPHLMA